MRIVMLLLSHATLCVPAPACLRPYVASKPIGGSMG